MIVLFQFVDHHTHKLLFLRIGCILGTQTIVLAIRTIVAY